MIRHAAREQYPRSSTRFTQRVVNAASKGIDWLYIVEVKAFIDLEFPDQEKAGAAVPSLTRGMGRFRGKQIGRVGRWANEKPPLWLTLD